MFFLNHDFNNTYHVRFARFPQAQRPAPRPYRRACSAYGTYRVRSGAEEERDGCRVTATRPLCVCAYLCVRPATAASSYLRSPFAALGCRPALPVGHPTHLLPAGRTSDACSQQPRCARCQPLGGRGARRRRLWRRPSTIRSGMRNEGPCKRALTRPAVQVPCGPIASRFSVRSEPKCSRLRGHGRAARLCRASPLWTACAPSDSVVNRASEFGDRVSPRTGCDASCPAGEADICLFYVCTVFDLPLFRFLQPHVCPAPRPHRRACSADGTYRCGAAQRENETGAACPAMLMPRLVVGRRLPEAPGRPSAPSFDNRFFLLCAGAYQNKSVGAASSGVHNCKGARACVCALPFKHFEDDVRPLRAPPPTPLSPDHQINPQHKLPQ